jgi:hypothetical protein
MLAVPADRLPAALADLDPGNRALLDLSLRRGVSDAEIGELLRKTPDDVARGRDAVLELLADALDVPGLDRRERVRRAVAALPDDAWRGGGQPPPAEPPTREEPELEVRLRRDTEPEPDVRLKRRPEPPTADDDIHFTPEPRRSRRGGLLAALGLLLVLGALAAILLAGGDDDDEPAPDMAERTGSQATPPGDERPGRGGGVALQPLTDAGARGRIAPGEGGLLVISIGGLPRGEGSYEAWLYDSVVDARSLGRFEGGARRLEGKLPPDAGEYRFLDISLEPADGNPNHSGDSVLRTPLAPLLDR